MNFLREIAGELSNLELTVKPHPACPINPADYTEINFEVSDQPLSDLLNLFDVAYTSCLTSAAVDAYCAWFASYFCFRSNSSKSQSATRDNRS